MKADNPVQYILDPSILLSQASSTFLQEPPEGHEIIVSPSLTGLVHLLFREPREAIEPSFRPGLGDLVRLWELPYDSPEPLFDDLYDLYSPRGKLTDAIEQAGAKGGEILFAAKEEEDLILQAALEAAIRLRLRIPGAWTAQSILAEQVALAHLLGSPVICQTTSRPAFFKILKGFGAKVIDEVVDEYEDAKEALQELHKKWHGWKDEHPRVVKIIKIAGLVAVEIVFVSLFPGKQEIPLAAGALFQSFLVLSVDPP